MNETTFNFKSTEFIDCFRLPKTFTHLFDVFIYLPVNYVNSAATQYISNVPVASKYAIIEIRISKMDSDFWLLHCELAYCFPDIAVGYQYFSLCSTTLQISREIRRGLHYGEP